jgi:hypothetical protein
VSTNASVDGPASVEPRGTPPSVAVNEAPRNYVVRNQTARVVVLKGQQNWLTLAPLQTKRIGGDPMKVIPGAARAAHRDRVIEWEPEPVRAKRSLWATWLAAVGIGSAAAGTLAYLVGGSLFTLVIGLGIAAVCMVVGAYIAGQARVSGAEHAVTGSPPASPVESRDNARDSRSVESTDRRMQGFRQSLAKAVARLRSRLLYLLLSVACAVGFLIAAGEWALKGGHRVMPFVVIGFSVGLLSAVTLGYLSGHEHAATGSPVSQPPLSPTPRRGDAWGLIRDFIIATGQGLIVVILVAVAVAAPALAIYYGTELSSVFHPWNHPRLVQGPHSQYLVVARALQLVLLILVSLIPALMYFQFDREKLTTLVNRWLHAIFRLDPSLTNVSDVDAKYGRRVEEFYGASLGLGVSPLRKRAKDKSPVIVATLLIAMGWILVLLNDQQDLNNQDAGTLPKFQALFQPAPTPMTLAFLGAYFLAVQVTLRGYVRGDLKPKTYNVITVRILMALILAWALQALWGTNKFTLGAAFLAGIVPSTVLRWIREGVEQLRTSVKGVASLSRKRTGVDAADDADELSEKSPLSRLDDVDIYDRTRLEEEGITSIQALARHDLVDLILSSRIPVPRLIDWVDQALLHQHVPHRVSDLRKLGIRTATDYLQVCESPKARAELIEAFQEGCTPAIRIELLCAVLERDEWVRYLRNWRAHDGSGAVGIITYDAAGRKAAIQTLTNQTHLNGFSSNGRTHMSRRVFRPLARAINPLSRSQPTS